MAKKDGISRHARKEQRNSRKRTEALRQKNRKKRDKGA